MTEHRRQRASEHHADPNHDTRIFYRLAFLTPHISSFAILPLPIHTYIRSYSTSHLIASTQADSHRIVAPPDSLLSGIDGEDDFTTRPVDTSAASGVYHVQVHLQ